MIESPSLIGSSGDSIREAFGRSITELGSSNERIIVLDGDVAGGTGAHHFRTLHPHRFVQCGIAEQNMVGVAAGLAQSGFDPWVTSFAAFLLRTVDQVRLSVAYPALNVKLVGSHTGLDVGPDGASAQAIEDIAVFRSIPNMSVVVPSTPRQMELAVAALSRVAKPIYLRSGRSPSDSPQFNDNSFTFGKAQVVRRGKDLTIVVAGTPTNNAVLAADILEKKGYEVGIIVVSTIKPLDERTILEVASSSEMLITVEDHNVIGGLGSAVAELVAEHAPMKVVRLGIQDVPGFSGEPRELYKWAGLDPQGIAGHILKELG